MIGAKLTTVDSGRKEFLKGALSSLALMSVSGRLTAKLYEPRTYDETALSFLVTEDGSHLVVLGEKYHYIVTPRDSPSSI